VCRAAWVGFAPGAAYEGERDELALVAHRGLSLDLRTAIERLPTAEEPWFIAARAAKRRRIVVEEDVAATTLKPNVALLLPASTHLCAIAAPLVAGREVLGMFVFFHKRQDIFDANARSFLEIATGLLTLARKAERSAPALAARSRDDARTGPLAMAGMLAAHFADDVRGPLSTIELVLREEERTLASVRERGGSVPIALASLDQLIREAQQAVARAQAVTNQIVSAARAGPKEMLVLAAVLREALTFVAPLAQSRSVMLVQEIEGQGRVLGKRVELVPAFVAMLTNALQACERGPRTRRPTVKIALEDEERGLSVTIEDTGAGVPADLRARIFEPFFSTSEAAAGIGLTLARHAIIGHSGHLEISMSPSLGGALFRAVLPRATDAKKPRRTSLSSATLRKVNPRPTLLWIDRDDVFLAGVRRALDGFEMRMAGSAAEGEQLMVHSSPAFVFCEIDLPDRSGLDLHADLLKKNPDLASRFVFVTDGVLSPERARYVLASGCPTLVKPIDLNEIRTLVQLASGERESPSSRRTLPNRPAPDVDDPFEM
jgi:signal transduction histidine kinase/ActR/RegA family two-component response regulator